MDKNYKQKVKDFFRKEGFYVVLFLCLCIVTTVAAISFKKASKPKNEAQNNEVEKEITLNVNDKNVSNEMPNAERVENDKKQQEETSANNTQATVVSNTTEVKFLKPIEGKLKREYTYPTPQKYDENKWRNIKGIDVEAKIGTSVKAAAEGVVEKVENCGPEEGMTVVIKHTNGLKTKYANLNKNISVKSGDKVTTETVLGTVGETATVFNKEEYGEHLNLQVINSKDEQVDPLKYFNYEK